MNSTNLSSEWHLLQNQFDSYEKHSLYIKLLSIFVVLCAEIFLVTSLYIIMILGVLWLQDAIWKTFQARIETRLLHVEASISEEVKNNAFQFNSEFMSLRKGGGALVSEYLSQALRPTVAFPHCVLVLIIFLHMAF